MATVRRYISRSLRLATTRRRQTTINRASEFDCVVNKLPKTFRRSLPLAENQVEASTGGGRCTREIVKQEVRLDL